MRIGSEPRLENQGIPDHKGSSFSVMCKSLEDIWLAAMFSSKVLARLRHSAGVEHGWADDLKI